ncbi:MAG TPA: TadE family protein [Symbiobacteriaceae bacterium]|nr:TadE family protein [Symbiobacteriaceae bacterium]
MIKHKRKSGSAMVEFALIAPLLILVLLGIMVMGIMINSKIVVAGAARDAGRTWAIYKQDAMARDRAADAIRDGGLKWAADGKVLFEPGRDVHFTSRGGGWIEATVTYKQPVFVPLIAELLEGVGADGLVTLRSTAIFKVER